MVRPSSYAMIVLALGALVLPSCASPGQGERRATGGVETAAVSGEWPETAAYQKAAALLMAPGSYSAKDQSFKKVLHDIEEGSHVHIDVDWKSLEGAGVDEKTQVTLDCAVPWRRILTIALAEVGGGTANLGYTIEDEGTITISTPDGLNSAVHQRVRVFDIGFLLDAVDPAERTDFIVVTYSSHTSPEPPAHPDTPMVGDIIELVKAHIAPDSWRDAGGTVGSIRYIKGMLVVSQTQDNLRTIAAIIADLRAKAEARVRAYDVSDLVGDDDRKLGQVMALVEGLSARRIWVERGGSMGTMRGMGGRIYVSGAAHVQEEFASILKVVRGTHPMGRPMNLLTPPVDIPPAPPQAPRLQAPASQPRP